MRSAQIPDPIRSGYPQPDGDIEDPYGSYKRPWKKAERNPKNFLTLCFYSKLNVNFEALIIDGWVTVDWINDCNVNGVDSRLESLKALQPGVCLRAINRTTGRLINFT